MRTACEISGRLGIGAEAWVELLDAEKQGPSSPVVPWRTFKTVMNALRHCGEKHYVNPPPASDRAVKEPTAGDLMLAAMDRWAEHAEACEVADCAECDARINQYRLSRKVWNSSAHKSLADRAVKEPDHDAR